MVITLFWGGRSSLEGREKRDYSREASRKRWSRSGSPPWGSSSRDHHDSDREKHREMERKSGGRERDDQDRDKSRESTVQNYHKCRVVALTFLGRDAFDHCLRWVARLHDDLVICTWK